MATASNSRPFAYNAARTRRQTDSAVVSHRWASTRPLPAATTGDGALDRPEGLGGRLAHRRRQHLGVATTWRVCSPLTRTATGRSGSRTAALTTRLDTS
jgi:hypothetical protein